MASSEFGSYEPVMPSLTFLDPLTADALRSMLDGHDMPNRLQVEGQSVRFMYRVGERDDRDTVIALKDAFVTELRKLGAVEVVEEESAVITDEEELTGRIEMATDNMVGADAGSNALEKRRWQNVLTELAEEAVVFVTERQPTNFDLLRGALRRAVDAGAIGAGTVLERAGWPQ